jgi:transducin (beta)-like 1
MSQITCLQWQPLQAGVSVDDERLLASGGEDGAICIWNVRNSDNKPKYSMTMEDPILALSMTPDGAFIAGATSNRVLIWKPGDIFPRASWTRPNSTEYMVENEEEDQTCLSWDADGHRLVYGANSRVSFRYVGGESEPLSREEPS